MKYKTADELEDAIVKTIQAIPGQMLFGVLQSWRSRLETCIQSKGEYVEEHESKAAERLQF
jgi:hypothetical protein